MNLVRATTFTLLACAGLLVWDVASAQARGPSRLAPRQAEQSAPEPADEAAAREAKLAELEEWLGRLEGSFRMVGVARVVWGAGVCSVDRVCWAVEDAQGVQDCARIGDGPGVHCIVNVPWPRFFRPQVGPGSDQEVPWLGPSLDPATVLYGIDPDNLAIRFLLADGRSRALEAVGTLQGNTVTFSALRMHDPDGSSRSQLFRIRAPSDGRPPEMSYELFTNKRALWAAYRFTLRRESPMESGGEIARLKEPEARHE